MACPDCDSPVVPFAVPPEFRAHAPGDGGAALCTRCLGTHPATGAGGDDPRFAAVSDAFPGGEGGVALALALGHLDSLALDRVAVVELCERAERAGVDVLLTLDRLAADPSVDPHFDLDRRQTQLASFLD